MDLPKAKLDNIVVQELKGELLVYNLTTHQAFQLNETSKIIFESCDGKQTFDELKCRHKFTDDLIHLALAELQKNNLVAGERIVRFDGMERRAVLKKVALMSAVALPVVTALAAPKAASAASRVAVSCPALEPITTVQPTASACDDYCQLRCTPCTRPTAVYRGASQTCLCTGVCQP